MQGFQHFERLHGFSLELAVAELNPWFLGNKHAGGYVLVADPMNRHDRSGNLVFEGPVETPREQDQVPGNFWEKVQPMIRQLEDTKSIAFKK